MNTLLITSLGSQVFILRCPQPAEIQRLPQTVNVSCDSLHRTRNHKDHDDAFRVDYCALLVWHQGVGTQTGQPLTSGRDLWWRKTVKPGDGRASTAFGRSRSSRLLQNGSRMPSGLVGLIRTTPGRLSGSSVDISSGGKTGGKLIP